MCLISKREANKSSQGSSFFFVIISGEFLWTDHSLSVQHEVVSGPINQLLLPAVRLLPPAPPISLLHALHLFFGRTGKFSWAALGFSSDTLYVWSGGIWKYVHLLPVAKPPTPSLAAL